MQPRVLAVAACLYACPVLQATVLHHRGPAATTPNLVFVVVCLCGLLWGTLEGALWGILGGLLLGGTCGYLGTPMASVYLICGWVSGILGQKVWARNPLILFFLTCSLSFLDLLMEMALLRHFTGTALMHTVDLGTSALIVACQAAILTASCWWLRSLLQPPRPHYGLSRLQVSMLSAAR